MLSREWRCNWSSADRRCSNYIWVINNFIAYWGASYIRDFMVYLVYFFIHHIPCCDATSFECSIDLLLIASFNLCLTSSARIATEKKNVSMLSGISVIEHRHCIAEIMMFDIKIYIYICNFSINHVYRITLMLYDHSMHIDWATPHG